MHDAKTSVGVYARVATSMFLKEYSNEHNTFTHYGSKKIPRSCFCQELVGLDFRPGSCGKSGCMAGQKHAYLMLQCCSTNN